MKNELLKLFESEINQNIESSYKKLITFTDAIIAQSFKLSGDDRAEFLIKNIIGIRDFMSSEIIIEKTKDTIKNDVLEIFDKFVIESDLDLKELAKIRHKKKENELEAEQLNQENLLETDRSTLSSKEES